MLRMHSTFSREIFRISLDVELGLSSQNTKTFPLPLKKPFYLYFFVAITALLANRALGSGIISLSFLHTAISIKVVHEQSGKVEYVRVRKAAGNRYNKLIPEPTARSAVRGY